MIHTLESWDTHWTHTSKAWDTVGYNNYKFWDTLYLQDCPGRMRVKERSTHARPGMHLQQCSAVLTVVLNAGPWGEGQNVERVFLYGLWPSAPDVQPQNSVVYRSHRMKECGRSQRFSATKMATKWPQFGLLNLDASSHLEVQADQRTPCMWCTAKAVVCGAGALW